MAARRGSGVGVVIALVAVGMLFLLGVGVFLAAHAR
jgi:hypothetical protein